jgi:nitrile hydratase subunit beta
MNGVHDMGGMHGMGPVAYEQNEPVFHDEWEARVYALTRVLRLGPKWNIDMSRATMEQLPPALYLGSSYYQRWLLGLEARLLASGVLSPEELADGQARPGGVKVSLMTPDEIKESRGPWRAAPPEADVPAKFHVGDQVVARNIHPTGHTRLPRYIRGHHGLVERDLGVHSLPDAWVARQEHKFQHVYSVRFAARELWGEEASAKHAVYVDLWDDYLDPLYG